MKLPVRTSVAVSAVAIAVAATTAGHGQSAVHDYPVQPVPFTSVHLADVFWAPRIETNRTATIPAAFQQCELTGRVDLFVRAAKALRGEEHDLKAPGYPFDDTDVYKVIEGASYALAVDPDPKLDAYVDGLIAKVVAAQEPDGYIYTTRTINPKEPHPWSRPGRWAGERDDSHELYNMGHLIEAAVAHNISTGKTNLLTVATKAADLLVATFGPGKRSIWPGHQITEMALVRLYRLTGKEEYLSLAKFMLDERGPTTPPSGERVNPRGLDYNQAQAKVIEQSEPVGHAVRAMYMYSGMADVAALTGDQKMRAAGLRIWDNLIKSKMYLTGGIGAAGGHEGFGDPYELPNMQAYNETCASVGMDYWNQRLFLLEGDAKFVDVLERTLFNGLISGVSLDGKTFFYPNPLESIGQHARQEWFGVACCPGNITRFMASVPGYIYAVRPGPGGGALYVNLYAGGTADIDMPGGKVKVVQDTRYPWDGAVKLTVTPATPREFTINLRIPGWARNEPVPSDLYRFMDKVTTPATLKVNGRQVIDQLMSKGYVGATRTWKAGDVIELNLPMPVRRVVANPQVVADRDRVALQRGPILYAAEWPDNPNGKVRNVVLPDTATLTSEFRPDLLRGVQVVRGTAFGLSLDAQGKIVKAQQPFMAIPYATWANRGRGQMAVWLARTDAAAYPTPYPTVATTSKVTTSRSSKTPQNIVDGEEPRSSSDSTSYFDWWPRNGCKPGETAGPPAPAQPGAAQRRGCSDGEWVEMTFAQPARVSQAEVYWFDDTGRGGVRVPTSWRLLYKEGDAWKPVETAAPFGTAKDAWNKVTFSPVTAAALRIELKMQPGVSAGVQEWKVK
ncbi:MAG: six-hairpin glycosidase [Acidobacteria bacterium RIFCSPLOWO2_12_FULL_66_21]|nr:MAG: six-hairpin glycosidase [Acidobacteria bacterium RIFCSPLOWO2_12_FULL_66_21]